MNTKEGWVIKNHPGPFGLDGFEEDFANCDITIRRTGIVNAINALEKLTDVAESNAEKYSEDEMKLAGLEMSNEEYGSARKQIADIVSSRYADMDIQFAGEFVTINNIPTRILVDHIRNVYVGIAGLYSHKKAIKEASKILIRKLDGLFVPKN